MRDDSVICFAGTNVSLDGRLGLSEGCSSTCGLASYVNGDKSGSANCEMIVFQDGKARKTKYGMQIPISADVPGAPNLQVVLRATRSIVPGAACRMNYRLK